MPQCDLPGFAGLLSGTSIEDVIQMSCLTLATRVIHVAGDGGAGRLFVGGGQVVHAETESARGEAALFEILGWKHGRFDVEDGRQPPEETITRIWQSVLLEAAYRVDENRRPPAGDATERTAPMEASRSMSPLDGPEVRGWVRFTLQGERTDGRAPDLEALQSCAAYVLELSQALGRALGLEGLSSLEARGPEARAVCRVRGGVALAVVAAAGVDVTTLADAGEAR
jgi:hypothetical protein